MKLKSELTSGMFVLDPMLDAKVVINFYICIVCTTLWESK